VRLGSGLEISVYCLFALESALLTVVPAVEEDPGSSIALERHMIRGAGVFKSQNSRHLAGLPRGPLHVRP